MSSQVPDGEFNMMTYHVIETSRKATYDRVKAGDLPFTMRELGHGQRLAVLLEEVGEIAQALKVLDGLKPKLDWTTSEALDNLEEELIQVAAIATDWLMIARDER